jgi:hypothetical protein
MGEERKEGSGAPRFNLVPGRFLWASRGPGVWVLCAEMDMGPFFFTQPNPTQPTSLQTQPNPTHDASRKTQPNPSIN